MVKQIHFLPLSFQAILRKKFHQFLGLACMIMAIYMVIALLSYDCSDPSWNTAVAGPVHNWCGHTGAILADILWQIFGAGSFLWSIILLNWAKLKITGKKLRWVKTTLSLFSVAVFMACFAFRSLGYEGGFLSELATNSLWYYFPILSTSLYKTYLALAMSMAAFILSCLCFNVSLTQLCKDIAQSLCNACQNIAYSLLNTYKAFVAHWRKDSAVIAKAVNTPKIHKIQLADTEFDDQRHGDDSINSDDVDCINSDIIELKNIRTKPVSKKTAVDIETDADYQLPPLNLLVDSQKTQTQIPKADLIAQAQKLMTVLEEFGVRGEIDEIRTGPVVTLYELIPAAGIKSSRVIGLADDIARSMSAISTRVAVIPGRNAIGIELPNLKRHTVYFKDLLTDKEFCDTPFGLPLALGKDIAGHAVVADLSRMPHLLVAGTTGSGKSVGINSMILSLIYRLPPERCKFIMIDPKMLELSIYNDIPHLLTPVVTEPKKAIVALKWAVREMENRYRDMSKLGVRNITGYNERINQAKMKGERVNRQVQTGFDPDTGGPVYENQPLSLNPLPYIVVVVDEMADLMLVAGKEIESAVQRLAQMARAAGIHLIMATQRPSVDVITGTIKANFPTRISFQVTSKIDSRTILGEQGAEQLLGMGDMLFLAPGGRTTRVHGPFVSDEEVEKIVHYLKQQSSPNYIESLLEDPGLGTDDESSNDGDKTRDEFYDQAVSLILKENKVSTSFVQRHFQIGYNRAARIVELMEEEGIVSAPNRTGRREILLNQRG